MRSDFPDPNAPQKDQRETGVPYPPPPGYNAGTNNSRTEPSQGTPDFDNPKNPRGIASVNCNGSPDNYALDAQKIENPTPARPPLNAADTTTVAERVSAGQNRKPPAEIVP